MQLSRVYIIFFCCFLVLGHVASAPKPQEPTFELPVQLVGFPVIIAAVRITNFVKKLAYSLNPQTYTSRIRRSFQNKHEEILDIAQVEKKLIVEMGERFCIYEKICARHAEITVKRASSNVNLDWDDIFSQYKASPDPMKENYFLSVFLGDIVGSPKLCHQLAKRGRACDDKTLSD